MSSILKSCAVYKAYLKIERLPKGVDAFIIRGNKYNVSPNLENPVLYRKKVRDRGALRNDIKKHSIRTRNVRKGGAPSIKKQEEYNYPRIVTLLKDLGTKVPYTKYLDTSSNNNKLDTKTPASPTPKKASKKGLKKSSLKAIKKKAAKESSREPIEDAKAIDK
ncbi:hypothetical protein V2W45_1333375 [Cenococcum geophilum]